MEVFDGSEHISVPYELPDVALVAWNIAGRCNLSCMHCYLRGSNGRASLPFAQLRRIADQIASIRPSAVFLAGGEPLLVKNLDKVAERMCNKGVQVYLNTNALLLTSERARQIAEAGIRRVIVGFDGVTHGCYETIRGPNIYEKAMRGIKAAKEVGLRVGVDFTLNAINQKELVDLPPWGDELGLHRITIKRYVPRPGSADDTRLRLSASNLRDSYASFLSAFPDAAIRKGCTIRAHDPLFLVARAELGCLREEDILHEDCNAAGSKRGWVGVSAEGNLQPCPVMTEVRIGNILKHGLEDLINHPKMTFIRDTIPASCQTCQHVGYCRGGCKATKVRLGVALNVPDPLCWVLKKSSSAAV